MGIVDQLLARVSKRHDDDLMEYRQIILRADRPKSGDDARLGELMARLNLSLADVKADIDVVTQERELQALAATAPERAAERTEAQAAADLADAELIHQREALRERCAEAHQLLSSRNHESWAARSAIERAVELRQKHPRVWPAEPQPAPATP